MSTAAHLGHFLTLVQVPGGQGMCWARGHGMAPCVSSSLFLRNNVGSSPRWQTIVDTCLASWGVGSGWGRGSPPATITFADTESHRTHVHTRWLLNVTRPLRRGPDNAAVDVINEPRVHLAGAGGGWRGVGRELERLPYPAVRALQRHTGDVS